MCQHEEFGCDTLSPLEKMLRAARRGVSNRGLPDLDLFVPICPFLFFQEPRKRGVLAKGVSVESSITAKEMKATQGYWPQQYICHSERHSQERRTFLQKPPPKTPLSWFLIFQDFPKLFGIFPICPFLFRGIVSRDSAAIRTHHQLRQDLPPALGRPRVRP